MNAFRSHLARITWLALFAMSAMALWPGVAQALARSGGWIEVCTAQGMKLVAADTGEPAPAHAGVHLEHCPLCSHAQGAWATPPVPAVSAATPAGAAWVPALFLRAPRTLFAWSSSRPRGPPVQS